MTWLRCVAAGALLAFAGTRALAALPVVASPPPPASPAGGGMLQAVLGLVVVVGLIFLLAWAARRIGLQRLTGSGIVKVISSAALGARERVVVVEVAGTWLVLGVTASQVNTLHTLPAQAAGPAPGVAQHAGPLAGMFSARLRHALAGKGPAA
ncbi:MAG: flagellar biosynthetic protein FliO [Ramlibacter sp.]